MNRGPAAPGATACGTIRFTFIQMDSGGAHVKKKRRRKQANRFSWNSSWKIRIGPSASWPLEGVLLVPTGCCDYCPVLWESCSTWKTDPGVDIWMSSGSAHASGLAVPPRPAAYTPRFRAQIGTFNVAFHVNKYETKRRSYSNKSAQTNVRSGAARRFVFISHVSP